MAALRSVLAAVIVLCSFATAQAESSDTFFPLGLWYEGGVGAVRDNVLPEDPADAAKIYDANFADIAAHGINVITVPNSPPNHHKPVLDAAHKHGLKVVLELDLDGGEIGHMVRGGIPYDENVVRDMLKKKLDPIRDHPALLRVQLLDEPPEPAFERYGKIAAIVRAHDPQSGPFCCLVGNVNGAAFLKHSKSDVVAFDTYPITAAMKEGDVVPLKHFASDAERFTKHAEAAGAKSWAVVQCHAITGGLRFPTPGELRAMTYASLATGNKGVFWFLYQTEAVGKDVIMSGLVDRQYKARPLWGEVTKLTKELAPLTPHLIDLRNPVVVEQSDPLLFVRKLTDSQGIEHIFIVNLDAANARRVTVPFPANAKVIGLPDGKVHSGMEVDLPTGGGKLFRIEPTRN